MEKITLDHPDSQSADLVAQHIEQFSQLFPEVIKEGKIDFDALQDLLGNYTDTLEERFQLNWAGKFQARREAQKRSTGTLRPCPVESVDWDTTENIYIEGDNLEVLKLLQKSYYKKVKMIYIDPPYNTGNDFVYKDNYSDNLTNYLEISGQDRTLGTNTESEGRYHSNWLNMMFPRLKLARNLLAIDGVIFVSIDDNEVHNLRFLMNEIFGEENFEQMIWRKSGIGRDGKMKNTTTFRNDHEYLMVAYKTNKFLNKSFEKPNWENSYGNPDNDPRGNYKAGSISRKDEASNKEHKNYYTVISPSGREITRQFEVTKSDFEKLNSDNRIYWGSNGDAVPAHKIFEDEKREVTTSSLIDDKTCTTTIGSKEIEELFNLEGLGQEMRPKPINLLKKLFQIGTNSNDLILDFFSGSSTTAHAVMQLNSEDGGNRKYIMVQLPETTPEDSEARKAGYKTIAEIGKERIRRAGKKIVEELKAKKSKEGALFAEEQKKLDIGFKVFKLDSSNINTWDSSPSNLEGALYNSVQNIKSDRTEHDLLYEILLKYGIDLVQPINEYVLAGKKVYEMGAGALIVCMADHVKPEVAEAIAQLWKKVKPTAIDESSKAAINCRVVFKDNGFDDNNDKTNVLQILKQHGIDNVVTI